jgi:hypothetical protein
LYIETRYGTPTFVPELTFVKNPLTLNTRLQISLWNSLHVRVPLYQWTVLVNAVNTGVLWLVLTRSLLAGGKRIPNVARGTAADGVVVHNVALGIDAAHAHAGAGTLGVEAGQGGRTVTVEDALWAAARGRTQVAGQAGAHRPTLRNATLRIGSAWGGRAGVEHHWRSDNTS